VLKKKNHGKQLLLFLKRSYFLLKNVIKTQNYHSSSLTSYNFFITQRIIKIIKRTHLSCAADQGHIMRYDLSILHRY